MSSSTISATADTYISSNTPTTAYGSGSDIYVGEYNGGSDVARTLIKFDLSSIPTGSTINFAILRFRDVGTDFTDNARAIQVYRLLRSWTEGTATWNTTDGSTSWGTAGAGNTTTDREASSIGSVTLPNPPVAGKDYWISLNASAVQEMISGGSFTNNGFMLKADTETNDMHRLYSRNDATAANRPDLWINYTPPGTSSLVFAKNAYGSGRITNNDPSWATLHAMTSGSYADQLILVTGVGFYLYRMFLSFDTSSIPDNATITGWSVSLFREDDEISYDNKNSVDIHMLPSTQANPAGLANADYDAITYSSKGSLALSSFNANHTWFTINGNDNSFINKSGYTTICLTTSLDLNNTAPTGSYGNSIGFNDVAVIPYMTVDFTVPSIPGGNQFYFM